jgi:hypothetical protein
MVARMGFEAMMKGEGDIVTGLKNKIQSAVANVTPAELLAKQHRKKADPRLLFTAAFRPQPVGFATGPRCILRRPR